MPMFRPAHRLSAAEFIPLMAMATALDALSIDSLLPALPALGHDLGVSGGNDAQLVIAAIFFGVALGQLAGGPLSDGYGRRPVFIGGLLLYLVGSVFGLLAPDFTVMLAARVLQGIGASIPMVVSTALVRDQFEGAPMARIMSFIGAVFIIVPILAPLAGQGLLLIGNWRMIFALYLVLGVTVTIWFVLRQPETLAVNMLHGLSPSRIWLASCEVVRNRVARGYLLAGGFLFGAFVGYLNSAQQIFQEVYGAGVHFALFFSSLALTIGVALLLNGAMVERFGMQRLTFGASLGLSGCAIIFLPVVLAFGGVPPLVLTMAYLLASFLCVGVLFGNLNALAMEPLGHIAGVGAAIVGFAQSIIGLPVATAIGRAFNGTVTPLVTGFAIFATLCTGAIWWAERGRAGSG